MVKKQAKKASRPGKKQEPAQELSEKELEQASGGVIAIIRDSSTVSSTVSSDVFGSQPGPPNVGGGLSVFKR